MPTSWNQSNLDSLRKIMDPAADAAIASVYQSQSSEQLRTALMQMATNDSFATSDYFSSADTPKPMCDLINNELSRKFSDDDISKFNRAHDIWREHGVQFIFVLFFRELPYTYAAETPSNVLRMTRLIEDQPARRIFETAQFVFDVMDVNWWEPNQRGVLTALKIRLMHAAMRYMLLNQEAGEKWDAGQWGMPISQEDLLATNQVFSLEFFKGLEIMGDPLSAEDQEAWFHTWKVLGSIMGIQDDLLLPTVPEAWELQTQVYTHLFNDVNYSGIGLWKALVEVLSKFMISTRLILIVMKKMMYDSNYPDSFNKILGPTYANEFGDLFMRTRSVDDETNVQEKLNDDFISELRNYQKAVTDYRENDLKNAPITRGERSKNLVDYQLDEFNSIFEEVDNPTATRGLVSDVMDTMAKKGMNAMAGVIIDVLSKYFREGKKAGFRIPGDLKEHWALA